MYTKGGRHCCSVFGPASGRRTGDAELKLAATEFCVDHFPEGSFHSSWDRRTNPSGKQLVYGATPSLRIAAAPLPEPRAATLRSAPQVLPPSPPMRASGGLRPSESLKKAKPAGAPSPLRPDPAPRSPAVSPAARRKFIDSKETEKRLAKARVAKAATAKAEADRKQRLATRHDITDRVDCTSECLAAAPVVGGGLDAPCSCRQVLDPAGLRQLPAYAMKAMIGVEEWDQLTSLYDVLDAPTGTSCRRRRPVHGVNASPHRSCFWPNLRLARTCSRGRHARARTYAQGDIPAALWPFFGPAPRSCTWR